MAGTARSASWYKRGMAAGDGSADREPLVEGYDELVPLGRGGFATVYRARQHRFDRTVALKVLDLERPDEEDRRRFDRECRAVGALSWHPNIVVVHDSGLTSDGRLYLAMEYLAEGSLASRVRAEGPLPWAEALPVGVELAGALEVAHRAGTLHRDLKPDNVLIGPFGEAKLADFGIAAVDGRTVTATGHGALTVLYAAPEILQGGRASVRTEVYGLASTLYALLAARAAHARDHDESIAAVVLRACSQPAPDLAERGVPGDLAVVVAAGMAIDPDDRPETAAELGRALQEVEAAHGLTVTALRTEPGGRRRVAPRVTPRRVPRRGGTVPRRWPRRRAWLRGGARARRPEHHRVDHEDQHVDDVHHRPAECLVGRRGRHPAGRGLAGRRRGGGGSGRRGGRGGRVVRLVDRRGDRVVGQLPVVQLRHR